MSETASAEASSPLIEVPGDFSAEAFGKTLSLAELESLSPAAVGALLEAGFSYALRSGGTLSKEKKAQVGTKGEAYDNAVSEAREKRYKDIMAGVYSMGRRGSGAAAATPLSKTMKAVAVGRLKALCTAKGVAMPTGDTRKLALSKIMETQEKDIRAEAEASLANAAAAAAALEGAGIFS